MRHGQPQHADLIHRGGANPQSFEPAENSSILSAAPFRTCFPTPIASAISPASAPNSRALLLWYCRQGWQLAVIEAPTAMSSFVLFSIAMIHHLLVFGSIDEGDLKKDTGQFDPKADFGSQASSASSSWYKVQWVPRSSRSSDLARWRRIFTAPSLTPSAEAISALVIPTHSLKTKTLR